MTGMRIAATAAARVLASAAFAVAAFTCAAFAEELPDGPLPAALEEPAGQALLMSVRGVGVQIYECRTSKDAPSGFAWTLLAPDAALQNGPDASWGRHYAGPTWEARDGSKVQGEVVAKVDAPDPTSIPWLLLRAKSTTGSGVFGAVLSIQRLNTHGGKAPATGCDGPHSGTVTRVPYTAEYRFFAATSRDAGR